MAPKVMSQVFRLNAQNSRNWAYQIALQEVSNSVESKVNGTVGQGLDKILLIKR